jgi:flagellar biosynthetic protein FliQ
MTDSTVLDIGHKALTLTIMVCAPMLGMGLIVGLIVSIFQAATQIHEATLTFVPKIVAVAAAMVIFGPWMLTQVLSFTNNLLQGIPTMVK